MNNTSLILLNHAMLGMISDLDSTTQNPAFTSDLFTSDHHDLDLTTKGAERDLTLFNDTFFYIVGVAGTLVCLVGIGGNSLSISVLMHAEMTSSATTTYLLVLAVYDILFLLARLLAVNGEWLIFGITKSRLFQLRYTTPVAAILEPAAFALGTGSIYTTVALTIDRCIAVTRPLKVGIICSKPRIRVLQIVIFFLSVLVNVPLFLETRLVETYNKEYNITVLDRTETEFRYTFFHNKIYLLVLYPVLKTFAPGAIIFICNSVIAATVLQSRQTDGMTTSDVTTRVKDAHRLTAQVVFISLVTLLSRVFEALTFVLMEINGTVFYDELPVYCFVIAALNEFLNTFNSAANFFCYCYFGQRFRAILLQRLGVCNISSCCISAERLGNGGNAQRASLRGSQTSTSMVSMASQTDVRMQEIPREKCPASASKT